MAKKHVDHTDEPDADAPKMGAGGPEIKIAAPAEVPCHKDFDVSWECEGLTEIVATRHGKIPAKSPLTYRASEQGPMTIAMSGTLPDGTPVAGTATVQVVLPPPK